MGTRSAFLVSLGLVFVCLMPTAPAHAWQLPWSAPRTPAPAPPQSTICSSLLQGYRSGFSREHVHARLEAVESFWQQLFAQRGWPFAEIGVVKYIGAVRTRAGEVMTSAMGPAYLPHEQNIYMPLDFFQKHAATLGPGSDAFLTAILAHEFGHHVQFITGATDRAEALAHRLYPYNPEAAQSYFYHGLELQADCFAGVYFNYLSRSGLASEQDIVDASKRMFIMGSDFQGYLARTGRMVAFSATGGYRHPDSNERQAWFERGVKQGTPEACEPYDQPVLDSFRF